MKRFEEIPHTADWSFRAFGRDLKEVFENAAFAMVSMEGVVPPEAAAPVTVRQVQATGIDFESLLVNWLSELLYLQESQHETFHRFQVELLSPTSLRAKAFGTPHGKIDKHIKAVTFHNLTIQQTPEGWQATVVVDV